MNKPARGLHGRRLMEVLARARPASLDSAPAPADAITACLAAAEEAPPARAARLAEGAPVHHGAQMPGPAARTPDPARRAGPAGRAWPTRRLALTAALSASAAAGLAVTLALTPGGGARPPGPHFAPAATAAAVLDNAALAALSEPALKPRPDQFVYFKKYTAFTEKTPYRGQLEKGTATEEFWLSVSGTRPGLNLETTETNRSGGPHTYRTPTAWCAHGHVHDVFGQEGGPCIRRYWANSLPWLPTTAAGMRAYLYRQLRLPTTDPAKLIEGLPGQANNLLAGAFSILTDYYLTPAQQAAMYHALATTPGLTVVPQVTDIKGQVGVGVRYHSAAKHITWTAIFDPTTFKPLGANIDLPPWGQHDRTAVVPPTIVDKAGQRP